MLLGTVVGRVWVDRQIDDFNGHRLVVVQEHSGQARIVAVDQLDAGVGQDVLVSTDEAAQSVTGQAGIDAVIVALVTGVDERPPKRATETGASTP